MRFTSCMGQNLGGGLVGRIKQGMRAATLVALGTSAVIAGAMLLFEISSCVFLSPALRRNRHLHADCVSLFGDHERLPAHSLYAHIYRSALMGLGDTVVPMLSGFAEMAVRIAVALFLPMLMGQEGIFFAEVGAWTAAAILW